MRSTALALALLATPSLASPTAAPTADPAALHSQALALVNASVQALTAQRVGDARRILDEVALLVPLLGVHGPTLRHNVREIEALLLENEGRLAEAVTLRRTQLVELGTFLEPDDRQLLPPLLHLFELETALGRDTSGVAATIRSFGESPERIRMEDLLARPDSNLTSVEIPGGQKVVVHPDGAVIEGPFRETLPTRNGYTPVRREGWGILGANRRLGVQPGFPVLRWCGTRSDRLVAARRTSAVNGVEPDSPLAFGVIEPTGRVVVPFRYLALLGRSGRVYRGVRRAADGTTVIEYLTPDGEITTEEAFREAEAAPPQGAAPDHGWTYGKAEIPPPADLGWKVPLDRTRGLPRDAAGRTPWRPGGVRIPWTGLEVLLPERLELVQYGPRILEARRAPRAGAVPGDLGEDYDLRIQVTEKTPASTLAGMVARVRSAAGRGTVRELSPETLGGREVTLVAVELPGRSEDAREHGLAALWEEPGEGYVLLQVVSKARVAALVDARLRSLARSARVVPR